MGCLEWAKTEEGSCAWHSIGKGENVQSASCRESFLLYKEGKQHFYVWIEEISLFSPMSCDCQAEKATSSLP